MQKITNNNFSIDFYQNTPTALAVSSFADLVTNESKLNKFKVSGGMRREGSEPCYYHKNYSKEPSARDLIKMDSVLGEIYGVRYLGEYKYSPNRPAPYIEDYRLESYLGYLKFLLNKYLNVSKGNIYLIFQNDERDVVAYLYRELLNIKCDRPKRGLSYSVYGRELKKIVELCSKRYEDQTYDLGAYRSYTSSITNPYKTPPQSIGIDRSDDGDDIDCDADIEWPRPKPKPMPSEEYKSAIEYKHHINSLMFLCNMSGMYKLDIPNNTASSDLVVNKDLHGIVTPDSDKRGKYLLHYLSSKILGKPIDSPNSDYRVGIDELSKKVEIKFNLFNINRFIRCPEWIHANHSAKLYISPSKFFEIGYLFDPDSKKYTWYIDNIMGHQINAKRTHFDTGYWDQNFDFMLGVMARTMEFWLLDKNIKMLKLELVSKILNKPNKKVSIQFIKEAIDLGIEI